MRIHEKIRNLKRNLNHFARQGISPAAIASAIALGVFIAFVPMVGVHTAMAFLLALIFRLNPLIVFLGTQISNPFTFPFQLFISAQVGHLLLHGDILRIQWSWDSDWKDTYLIPIVFGSFVLGLIVSSLSYTGTHLILKRGKR